MEPKKAVAAAVAIADQFKVDVHRAADSNDLKRTKAVCTQAESDLRDIKRSLTQHKQAMNAAFTAERQKIDKSGQLLGSLGNSKMRGAMSRGRADSKRNLAAQKLKTTDGYRTAGNHIDNLIAGVKKTKASISTTPSPKARQTPPPPRKSATVSVADELAKLAKLRDSGVLTDEEFASQKAKLL